MWTPLNPSTVVLCFDEISYDVCQCLSFFPLCWCNSFFTVTTRQSMKVRPSASMACRTSRCGRDNLEPRGFTPRVLEHVPKHRLSPRMWYDRCHMNVSTGNNDSIAGLPGKEEAETFATSLPVDPGPDSSSIAEWHRDSHTVIESYVQPAGRQRPSIPELRVESVLQEHLSRMSWKSKGALCRKASWDHWCWTRRGSGGSTGRTYGSKSWVFWRSWRTSNWSTTNPWAAAPRSNSRSCSWRWGSLWIWCWSWTSGWR